MDSEHRHELNENLLATWLSDKIEVVKPRLPMILLGFGAAVVASLGWTSWNNSSAAIEGDAWQGFSMAINSPAGAPSLDILEQVRDQNAGTSVVPWADVTWADGQLFRASASLLNPTGRDDAVRALEDAEANYKALLADRAAPDEVRQRAQIGVARIAELRGDVDAAVDAYDKVTGVYTALAEARAEALADADVRADVEWLASAEATTGMPGFGGGGFSSAAPDATPDPIDLPSDNASSDDVFGELMKSLNESADAAEAAAQAAESDTAEPDDADGGDSEENAVAPGEDGDADVLAPAADAETDAPEEPAPDAPASEPSADESSPAGSPLPETPAEPAAPGE